MKVLRNHDGICERFGWEFDYFKICGEVLTPTSVRERPMT